jgi:hypothetical protein
LRSDPRAYVPKLGVAVEGRLRDDVEIPGLAQKQELVVLSHVVDFRIWNVAGTTLARQDQSVIAHDAPLLKAQVRRTSVHFPESTFE